MAASPNLTANSSCPKDLYPTIVKEVPSTSSDAVTQALRRQLIQSLPGPEVIKCLVDIYFDQMAWNARAICRPQFEHDCKEVGCQTTLLLRTGQLTTCRSFFNFGLLEKQNLSMQHGISADLLSDAQRPLTQTIPRFALLLAIMALAIPVTMECGKL